MPDTRSQLERIGDRVSVPQPAFDRLVRRRGQKERNRRIAAGVVGMLVFAAGVIAFSGVMAGSPRRPANETPSPAIDVPTFGPRTFEAPDVQALILSDDEAPSCTKAYNGSRGLGALFQVEGPARYAWGEEFFRGAGMRAFYDYVPIDTACGSPHGKVYVKSWAAVFANEEAAANEMHLYISNVVETWDWADLRRSDPGLSQDGVLLEGSASAFNYVLESGTGWGERTPGVYYMWRINNLVLLLSAAGGYDAQEMRSIAELMTSRAQTCSTLDVGQAC